MRSFRCGCVVKRIAIPRHDDEIDEVLGLRHNHGWIQSRTAALAAKSSAG